VLYGTVEIVDARSYLPVESGTVLSTSVTPTGDFQFFLAFFQHFASSCQDRGTHQNYIILQHLAAASVFYFQISRAGNIKAISILLAEYQQIIPNSYL